MRAKLKWKQENPQLKAKDEMVKRYQVLFKDRGNERRF